MTLLYDIIFLTHGSIPQYKVDPRLDLDSALMDSSLFPLSDWLYDSNAYAPISPEPRTPLSATSSLSSSHSSMSSLKSYIAKSERRKSQGNNSHQISTKPTYIRAPPTNRPSFPPATHTILLPPPAAAAPAPALAPLVLHMPRPVPVVQFINFFREFNR